MDKNFFTQEEKAKYFDEIAAHFYERNFGSISKQDMELLMFKFYLEKLIDSNLRADGTIDYNLCSDYKISTDLGITQQRVRNLKVKKQLVYPKTFKWEKALAHLTENARYDSTTKKIVISIPDPNLYLEIQNYLESEGTYIEKHLNSKLLVIRAEYYIDLVVMLENAESRKKVIKELKKLFKDKNVFDERHIGESIIKGAVDITTILANISAVVSPENYLWKSLIDLIKKYTN